MDLRNKLRYLANHFLIFTLVGVFIGLVLLIARVISGEVYPPIELMFTIWIFGFPVMMILVGGIFVKNVLLKNGFFKRDSEIEILGKYAEKYLDKKDQDESD